MNPIMIDYDDNTILDIKEKIWNSATFLPAYKLSIDKESNNYDKFSIGGLFDIILSLQIKFKPVRMVFPLNNKFIIDTTNTFIFLYELNIIGYLWSTEKSKIPASKSGSVASQVAGRKPASAGWDHLIR
jgi:hypothetical protein